MKQNGLTDQDLYDILMNSDSEEEVEADSDHVELENLSSEKSNTLKEQPANEQNDLEYVIQ